jgi:hypothetical protein
MPGAAPFMALVQARAEARSKKLLLIYWRVLG